jgi:hypothetical protein
LHGDGAIAQAQKAITQGRDAVQSLRISTIERNDLAEAIMARGAELAAGGTTERSAAFRCLRDVSTWAWWSRLSASRTAA